MEDPRTASLPAPAEPADDPEAAPSFVVVREGRVRLLVAASYEQALRAAGLTDAARLGALTDGLVPDRTRNAGRAATCIVETERGPVFVKRALKGGALGPLFAGRVPRFARVAHEIEVTAELHRRSAPVLEPVVAAGVRDALGWRAIVGTVFVEHALDGASALAHALERDRGVSVSGDVSELCRRFGQTIRAFHEAGGRHADLAVTNLLLDPADMSVRVIDLQGGRAGAPAPPSRRRLELARLRRSIERRPEARPALESGWKVLVDAYCEPPARWSEALAGALGAR